ncbi:MAG: hypothetical protein C0392_15080 [Syntrophus sp. (in: bacteria)]|nr:hypothetical protein [Syntrophus sp. (in: bacteria)]
MKIWPKTGAIMLFCALFVLIVLDSLLNAQQGRGGRGGQSGPRVTIHNRDKIIPPEYDNGPFDITATQLPPLYYGYNIELLYNSIKKKERGNTNDFKSPEWSPGMFPREAVPSAPGGLNYAAAYAFRLKPAEGLFRADSQAMQVFCELSAIMDKGKEDRTRRGFGIKKIPQMDNKFTYTNASGKKMEIEEIRFQEYAVAFTNFGEFPVERRILPGAKRELEKGLKKGKSSGLEEQLKRDLIVANIPLKPGEAKLLEERIETLVICKLVEPYITSDTVHEQATPERLREYFAQRYYLNAVLLELWFYDFETGKILMKMKAKENLRVK